MTGESGEVANFFSRLSNSTLKRENEKKKEARFHSINEPLTVYAEWKDINRGRENL